VTSPPAQRRRRLAARRARASTADTRARDDDEPRVGSSTQLTPQPQQIKKQGFAGEFSRRVVSAVAPERAAHVPAAVDAVFASCVAAPPAAVPVVLGLPPPSGRGGGGGAGSPRPTGSAGGGYASGGGGGGGPLLVGRDLRLEWVHECK
jgi:uncharacterized membrane protein YgcG